MTFYRNIIFEAIQTLPNISAIGARGVKRYPSIDIIIEGNIIVIQRVGLDNWQIYSVQSDDIQLDNLTVNDVMDYVQNLMNTTPIYNVSIRDFSNINNPEESINFYRDRDYNLVYDII